MILNNTEKFQNVGIGIDIEKCERFQYSKTVKDNFFNKIFTKSEMTYCLEKDDPKVHFCARFAAKEATIKAISSLGFSRLPLIKIEIMNNSDGAPYIRINDKKLKDKITKLSLSHTETDAIAIVIIFHLGNTDE